MLTTVPAQTNASARLVTLHHPNAMPATVLRKTVLRQASTSVGGMPTLGGIGVLSSEDEDSVTWAPAAGSEEASAAKVLFCGVAEPMSHLDDDAPVDGLEIRPEVEALVEFVEAGHVAQKNDLILVTPGGGIVLCYEVTRVQGTVNLPPYTRKYVLQARDELSFVADIAANIAAR